MYTEKKEHCTVQNISEVTKRCCREINVIQNDRCCCLYKTQYTSEPLEWQDVSNFHSLTVRLDMSFKAVHVLTFRKWLPSLTN